MDIIKQKINSKIKDLRNWMNKNPYHKNLNHFNNELFWLKGLIKDIEETQQAQSKIEFNDIRNNDSN